MGPGEGDLLGELAVGDGPAFDGAGGESAAQLFDKTVVGVVVV